jgi:hypothetical protein
MGNLPTDHYQGSSQKARGGRTEVEEEDYCNNKATGGAKPLEGERRDVEEGAIEKSGESEVGERMAEQGRWGEQLTGVEMWLRGWSQTVVTGMLGVHWMMIFSYSQPRDSN